MRIECAWCAKDGLPAFLRDVEPLDSNEVSHGICDRHEAEVMNAIHDMNEHKRQIERHIQIIQSLTADLVAQRDMTVRLADLLETWHRTMQSGQ